MYVLHCLIDERVVLAAHIWRGDLEVLVYIGGPQEVDEACRGLQCTETVEKT